MVTHLQFADDTLFFCEAVRKEVLGCIVVLRCFEMVSGLGINLGKSTFVGIVLEDDCLKNLADDLGCGVGKLPFEYLGLPIGGSPRSKKISGLQL